jgi:hypothetical protein
MQTTQGKTLQSLRAVQDFLDTYADRLGPSLQTGKRKQLDEAVIDLAATHAKQSASVTNAKSLTARQAALRKVLLNDHMKPIARIARADLPDTPEVRPLLMPRGRPSIERLAGHAYGMAQTASQFSATFIKSGLPDDFVAQLVATADAMLAAVDARTQQRGDLTGATQSLKDKLGRARRIVGVLDAFVQTAAKGDSFLLGKWNSVKRVNGVGGGTQAGTAPDPDAKQAGDAQ